MARITIHVNGMRHAARADGDTPLLYVLRDELRLHGPRFGCGLAQCGSCTVQLAGQPIRSCVVPVAAVSGKPITTLEGLGTSAKPHPVQTAFLDAQAAQCGWCTNAQILAAASYIQSGAIKVTSSEDDIKRVMNSYLCRCGTHYRILEAIQNAAKAIAK